MSTDRVNAYEIINGEVRKGIPIQSDDKIHVGEEGRSRTLVRVPLPPEAEVDYSKRRVMYIPIEQGKPTGELSTVVLIRDHSGFRGSWKLTAARSDEEWEAIVRYESTPRESDDKAAPVPPRRPHDAYVIAQGYCAQGAAGRMGGGPEYLLILRENQAVEIVRSGRLYGEPSTLRVELDKDGSIKVTDPRAKAMERLAAARWQGFVR